jgi:hypothetical protein
MKRIIIPTDFSYHSKHTIEYILNFMRETKIRCQLLLVNTYMVQQTNPTQVILMNDELKKKSKIGLELERIDALKKNTNPLITVETNSQMGSLTNVIKQMLQAEKIDLVAMGKDGGRHVEQIASLLREIECPLLITYINRKF